MITANFFMILTISGLLLKKSKTKVAHLLKNSPYLYNFLLTIYVT
jgi:hypothetical protein